MSSDQMRYKIQKGVQANIAISRRSPRLSQKFFFFMRSRIRTRQKFSFVKTSRGTFAAGDE